MINENQKQTNDNYRKGYDRIFGKKKAKDLQQGKRTHIDAQGRKHDNQNMESFALTCHPDQVAWHNKYYGHLGGHWKKDGTCIIKDTKSQRALFREHNMFLKNDTQGGPGSARKYLVKTGKMTEQEAQPPKPAPPPPLRKGDMSRKDARLILERARRNMKLTG